MSLDPALVTKAHAHLLGEYLETEDAAALARTLWSREELLASLILNRRMFGDDKAANSCKV
jgi:hypothetical protein